MGKKDSVEYNLKFWIWHLIDKIVEAKYDFREATNPYYLEVEKALNVIYNLDIRLENVDKAVDKVFDELKQKIKQIVIEEANAKSREATVLDCVERLKKIEDLGKSEKFRYVQKNAKTIVQLCRPAWQALQEDINIAKAIEKAEKEAIALLKKKRKMD
ncbi:MAG: hypothetical protein ABIC04_01885 [Nanoarchaeota archaeon]